MRNVRGRQRAVPPAALLTPVDYPDVERPRTRGDCLPGGCNEERPCPFVGCRHHIAIATVRRSGAVLEAWPGLDVDAMPETCSLDVADRGGITLEQIGEATNCTREWVRQTEKEALRKLRRGGKR